MKIIEDRADNEDYVDILLTEKEIDKLLKGSVVSHFGVLHQRLVNIGIKITKEEYAS